MHNKKDLIEGIKSGSQIAVKNAVIPAIDVLVAQSPEWLAPWMIVKGLFGVVFDFQQEKIGWFVQYLQENTAEFSRSIISTSEFQEGFVITFENYIRQRGEKRRELIQQIFLDYTKSANKEEFELERLYRTTELISLDAVRFLGFINTHIWPHLTQEIQSGNAISVKLSEKIGDFFRRDNNSLLYTEMYSNYLECMAELTVLGIITGRSYKTVTYDGETNLISGFTEFGLRFLKYVINE